MFPGGLVEEGGAHEDTGADRHRRRHTETDKNKQMQHDTVRDGRRQKTRTDRDKGVQETDNDMAVDGRALT